MTAVFDFPIIVLAAGQSRRMQGRDKLLEDVDGAPLIRRQVKTARSATTGAVMVALPPRPHPRYQALDGLDVTLLSVPDAGTGMNASLRHSFAALPRNAPCAMVLLGDLPDLEVSDLCQVAAAVDLTSGTQIWRGATAQGGAGHPIIFHNSLFDAFATLHGDSGGREVVAKAEGRVELIPLKGARARADLDTPEDWAAWRRARG
jgi:molybdenum cofactor cytidylyltransferase